IDFAVNGIILLTAGELAINKNLIITGPGAASLTVERSTALGTPDFRVFRIQSGVVSTISGLTISNGRAADGGGIRNEATFMLLNCVISGNAATNTGGGINNLSTLTMSNSVVRGNSVATLPAGPGLGGGMNNGIAGTLTVIRSL